ncbi:hypothetical protein [Pendulispora albinea]|uniref:Uncharacterized protein n=1 Tax=Pendulispora albinea TaxID=2741071 RepID=A0ABZ2MB96_9BACT
MGALYECAVVVVGDGRTFFTCGMHHFDRPDAEISMDDPRAAIAWLDTFHVYQLTEDPVLASGHTFRPDDHGDESEQVLCGVRRA